jgi:hypothetical protein
MMDKYLFYNSGLNTNSSLDIYKSKYLIYKRKYLNLKYDLLGGGRKTKIDLILKDHDELVEVDLFDDDKFNLNIKPYVEGITELLCLDFHGVTDLFDVSELIPNTKAKCVISYIGGNPKTIISTKEYIKKKIEMEEVLFGIIVYQKDNKPKCGTKGWIIKKILENNVKLKIDFIDDSRKNISCVKGLNDSRVKVHLINKRVEPKTQLINLLQRI